MAGRRNNNNNGEMGGQNNQFLEGLTALLHEQNRIHGEQIQQILQAREQGSTPRRSAPSTQPVYKQFRELGPTEFKGTTDPIAAEGWIRSLETIFDFMQLTDADKVRCTIFMLRDDARVWWEGARLTVDLATLTWTDFKEVFYGKYFTVDNRTRLAREFLELRQGDLSVAEYVRRFERGRYFVPMITRQPVEESSTLRKGRDQQEPGKKKTIPGQNSGKQQFKQAQPRQQIQKTQAAEGTGFKVENKVRCSKCEKIHAGQCLTGTDACFMCKKSGHFARECPLLREPIKGRIFAMTQEQVDLDTTIITGGGIAAKKERHRDAALAACQTAAPRGSSYAVGPSFPFLLHGGCSISSLYQRHHRLLLHTDITVSALLQGWLPLCSITSVASRSQHNSVADATAASSHDAAVLTTTNALTTSWPLPLSLELPPAATWPASNGYRCRPQRLSSLPLAVTAATSIAFTLQATTA
ncbi:hypothetical protein ZIOFF_024394 [Zingiber officinale]|uniref:CCHC-type domain-containing protein n=1 Tax=Zingiber officinale TaxID=94328 RepID=A0A8J5HC07_ZINOF|nr:hypothetical protein ZIOFF_024394 [Zingiber officinale]